MPLFEDEITGEIFNLDINPHAAKEYGYTLVPDKRGSHSIADSEYFGAQDPVFLEREHQNKIRGTIIWDTLGKKRPG